jgi:hypothetical protein
MRIDVGPFEVGVIRRLDVALREHLDEKRERMTPPTLSAAEEMAEEMEGRALAEIAASKRRA